MKVLTGTPAWESYLTEVLAMEARKIESLIQETADAERKRGFIEGLRWARTLPDYIMAKTL